MANDVVTLTQRFSSWWAVGRGITQRYLPPKAPVKAALGQHWDPFKNLFDECFAGWFALYFKWLNQLETPDLYKAARACANVCLCQADILRFPPKNKTELSSNKIKDPGDSSLKRGLPGPLVVAEPPGPGRFEYHSLAGSRAYQIPASLVVNTRLPPFCTWAKKKMVVKCLELWEKKLGSFSCLQWWHVLQVLEISGKISPFFARVGLRPTTKWWGGHPKNGKKTILMSRFWDWFSLICNTKKHHWWLILCSKRNFKHPKRFVETLTLNSKFSLKLWTQKKIISWICGRYFGLELCNLERSHDCWWLGKNGQQQLPNAAALWFSQRLWHGSTPWCSVRPCGLDTSNS